MAVADFKHMSVAQIMDGRPEVLRVFLSWHLRCIGCPVAPFHTLADSALAHGYAPEALEAAVYASAATRARRHRQSAAGDADP